MKLQLEINEERSLFEASRLLAEELGGAGHRAPHHTSSSMTPAYSSFTAAPSEDETLKRQKATTAAALAEHKKPRLDFDPSEDPIWGSDEEEMDFDAFKAKYTEQNNDEKAALETASFDPCQALPGESDEDYAERLAAMFEAEAATGRPSFT